jgi:hypothetical protein
MRQLRRRFWIEVAVAAASALALLATLLWREWIELVFHVDPDGGSGALEWLIVAVTATAALGCASLAPVEWRRAAPAATE